MSKDIQVTIQVVKNELLDQNTYFVINQNNEALIIDPGYSKDEIEDFIFEHNLNPVAVLLTHYHFDHLASAEHFCEEYGLKAYIHKNEEQYLNNTLALSAGMPEDVKLDKQYRAFFEEGIINIEGFEVKVINTKGHSEGSSLFVFGNNVITGDVLFFNTVGRADLPGSNPRESIRTNNWLKENLKDEMIIYPGHGQIASFAEVKLNNKFMK